MNDKIRILITGGTIDCHEIIMGKYIFTKTHIFEMLKQSNIELEVTIEELFLKDSSLMTDEDRNIIYEACRKAEEDKIIILHGTDTMVETAKYLNNVSRNLWKTIILTGSMIPYNKPNSDALFNLGSAFFCRSSTEGCFYKYEWEGIFSLLFVRKK